MFAAQLREMTLSSRFQNLNVMKSKSKNLALGLVPITNAGFATSSFRAAASGNDYFLCTLRARAYYFRTRSKATGVKMEFI
jgi:hypothetical protein